MSALYVHIFVNKQNFLHVGHNILYLKFKQI